MAYLTNELQKNLPPVSTHLEEHKHTIGNSKKVNGSAVRGKQT